MAEAYKNRGPVLETSGEVIGFYEREFYVFSNFSSFAVEWNGRWNGRLWPTNEHAYQASKFFKNNPETAEEIYNARSTHAAEKLAKEHQDKRDPDFDDKKVEIMEDICRHKLNQHPYVQKKLKQTENKYIVEDSPKDNFWGWGVNRDGNNELGKIWMRLREEFYGVQN